MTTKKNMPYIITQIDVDRMLYLDTRWIIRYWDGKYETLCSSISEKSAAGAPFMLYSGNKAERHALHKKLGSNFSHSSINMDDGSRVMIIINKPGYIYTDNDHSVCFFTPRTTHAATDDDDIFSDWELKIMLDRKGGVHYAFMYNIGNTLNEWRENVNKIIRTAVKCNPPPRHAREWEALFNKHCSTNINSN